MMLKFSISCEVLNCF